jgi:hypothetical protein
MALFFRIVAVLRPTMRGGAAVGKQSAASAAKPLTLAFALTGSLNNIQQKDAIHDSG